MIKFLQERPEKTLEGGTAGRQMPGTKRRCGKAAGKGILDCREYIRDGITAGIVCSRRTIPFLFTIFFKTFGQRRKPWGKR
jgi:hypothetical protein